LSRLLKNYKDNGGIPDLLYDAGLSVNYNLVSRSSQLDQWSAGPNTTKDGFVTAPDGTNTAYQLTNTFSGSAFYYRDLSTNILANTQYTLSFWHRSPVGGTSLNVQIRLFGTPNTTNTFSFTSSTTWTYYTFTFTTGNTASLTGSQLHIIRPDFAHTAQIWNPQIVLGATDRAYRGLDGSTVKPLNLGKDGLSGDGTFVNGSNANMLFSDPVSGLAYNFVSASSQRISTTTFAQPTDNFTVMSWIKPTSVATLQGIIGAASDSGFSMRVNSTSKLNFSRVGGTSQSIDSTASLTANTWQHVAVSRAGTDVRLYINGVLDTTFTTYTDTLTSQNYAIGCTRVSAFAEGFNGCIDRIALENSVLTDTQIANIFNSQKSQYGL
jgi:hypothetical protein